MTSTSDPWNALWTRLQIERRREKADTKLSLALQRWFPDAYPWGARAVSLRGQDPRKILLCVVDRIAARPDAFATFSSHKVIQKNWLAVLKHARREPLAIVAALEVAEIMGSQTPNEHMRALLELFGPQLYDAAIALVMRDRPARRVVLYQWLGREVDRTPLALLLKGIVDRKREVRDAATAGFRHRGRSASDTEALLALLASPEAHAREGAARALRFSAGAEALAPLRASLAEERVGFVEKAIRRAIHICDPDTSGPMPGEEVHCGTYDWRAPFDASAGLAELRELLNDDEQSPQSWVRLCNIVERLRDAHSLALARDYIGFYGLESWSPSQRVAPFEWYGDPQLMDLCVSVQHEWVTLQSLVAGRLAPYLEACFEQARLDVTADARALFLRCVDVGWRFCEEHGLAVAHLRVAVRFALANPSGVVSGHSLVLHQGFGLRMTRGQVEIGARPAPEAAHFEVNVPGDHPLRRTQLLDGSKALDLFAAL